jgi:hypothetical protein
VSPASQRISNAGGQKIAQPSAGAIARASGPSHTSRRASGRPRQVQNDVAAMTQNKTNDVDGITVARRSPP